MTDEDESSDGPMTIECATHGTRTASVVCGHLTRPTDMVLGFVENSSDPDDLQAWCDACERMFVREQEMTEAFRKFTDMCIVCNACYARLKQQHTSRRN